MALEISSNERDREREGEETAVREGQSTGFFIGAANYSQ